MHLFRAASPSDLEALFELARHLDTVNLPADRGVIAQLLERSAASFNGPAQAAATFDPSRLFLFVLEGPGGAIVGTSMIHAQHGTIDEPHVFFSVWCEERAAVLEPSDENPGPRHVHMRHQMLNLGQTYDGPTELGGLVLDPAVRGHKEKLGRLLSFGRFAFIAAFRPWIRDRLLAELLPPLVRGPGETRSPLWDVLGHRFTGLTYADADKMSRVNKEFIWALFPRTPVHVSLLPVDVQAIIGRVGPETEAARSMLARIGFTYEGRVDPFDGGPHYEAVTDEVTLVRQSRRASVLPEAFEPDPSSSVPTGFEALVSRRSEVFPWFRAVGTRAAWGLESEGSSGVRVPQAVLSRLEVVAGDEVWVTPIGAEAARS